MHNSQELQKFRLNVRKKNQSDGGKTLELGPRGSEESTSTEILKICWSKTLCKVL